MCHKKIGRVEWFMILVKLKKKIRPKKKFSKNAPNPQIRENPVFEPIWKFLK